MVQEIRKFVVRLHLLEMSEKTHEISPENAHQRRAEQESVWKGDVSWGLILDKNKQKKQTQSNLHATKEY